MKEQIKTRTRTLPRKKGQAGVLPDVRTEPSAAQPAAPVYAIVPAAGSGTRMNLGHNKLFMPLGGCPMIVRTLRALDSHPAISGYIVVAAEGEIAAMRRLAADYALKKCLAVTAGGPTRQISVLHGLIALESSHNSALSGLAGLAGLDGCLVLVHDGARCFVTPEIISRVISGIRQFQACGAAIPVKDTIKLADKSGLVVKTLDRSLLWAMQTPQGATYRLLRAAYDLAIRKNWQVTDDLSVLELAGIQVHLVGGDEKNIKLTTPEDRLLGEQLAQLADRAEET